MTYITLSRRGRTAACASSHALSRLHRPSAVLRRGRAAGAASGRACSRITITSCKLCCRGGGCEVCEPL